MPSKVLHHLLRVNVCGYGYRLYSGRLPFEFTAEPFDVASDRVPRSFLAAQSRLDTVLQTGTLTWSMAFRHDSQETCPLVAYGTLIDSPDDKGRRGISFVHAFEVDSEYLLYEYVTAVAKLLSGSSGFRMGRPYDGD